MANKIVEDLKRELKQVNILLKQAQRREKDAVLVIVRDQVQLYGITQQQLLRAGGFIKERRKRPRAKYYDPATGKSWCGRGSRPKWLVDKNCNDYLLDKSQELQVAD